MRRNDKRGIDKEKGQKGYKDMKGGKKENKDEHNHK